jgi:hypothetical protein
MRKCFPILYLTKLLCCILAFRGTWFIPPLLFHVCVCVGGGGGGGGGILDLIGN